MNLLFQLVLEHLNTRENNSSVAIWGSGQVGDLCEKAIKASHKHFNFKGFVDSNTNSQEGSDGPVSISPTRISEMDVSLVIVASIAFEAEIVSQLKEQINPAKTSYFAFSEIPLSHNEKLSSDVWMLPFKAETWAALADDSGFEKNKRLFTDVSALLK